MDYTPIVEHFQEFYLYYIGGAIVLAPLIFFTRKYSVPLIFFTVEIIIYSVLMHIFMHYLVAITRWFKEKSSMKALRADGRPVDAPEWGTPLIQFWEKELYNPEWIIYAEGVFLVAIIFLVFRYRPMKVQRVRDSKYFNKKGGFEGKPGRPGSPGAYGSGGAGRPGQGAGKGKARGRGRGRR